MNIIGFSHYYTKLHGQVHGELMAVKYFDVTKKSPPLLARKYDTCYFDDNAEEQFYKLENGHYLQLTFMGDLQIPFTTYRKCFPKPFKDIAEAFWTLEKHYIGQSFAFKFRGEELSSQLKKMIEKERKYREPISIFD